MTYTVEFYSPKPLPWDARERLSAAKREVFGDEPVEFVPVPHDTGVVLRLDNLMLHPQRFVVAALRAVSGTILHQHPFEGVADKDVLYLDIESHRADARWDMPLSEFFRLGQFAFGPTGEVHTTTDYREVIDLIEQSEGVVAHNGHPFDFSVMLGDRALEMAQDGRLFDTMIYAHLTIPAPDRYVTRNGHIQAHGDTPSNAMKWLGLDNLLYQFSLPGKVGDLDALAEQHSPKGDPKDYGAIPQDDPVFLEYAVGDIVGLQGITSSLLTMRRPDAYDWREQLNAAIDSQITRNGFRLDIAAAQARVDDLAFKRDEVLQMLRDDYGLPTSGAQPWRSTLGKAAIWAALKSRGVTPDESWPRVKTGYSLGGKVLLEQTDGTDAHDLGVAIAGLMGQRPLAQQALDNVHSDGKVHPNLVSFQRSGRTSVSAPGLTVWTSRGPGAIEKSYFVPDSDDESLVEFDYSQADARIVAAYSGDTRFAERFAEGVDGHEITGRLVFGDSLYDSDPDRYRQTAKSCGHAYAYRARPATIAATSKQPLEVATMFVEQMERSYPVVTAWQDKVTSEGARGFVQNDWGRRMVVIRHRAYTQAPAMYGQSGTREIMVDAKIRMLEYDPILVKWIKVTVHDAMVFSIPNDRLEWATETIKTVMSCVWGPREGGQKIEFPVSHGEPSTDWQRAGH